MTRPVDYNELCTDVRIKTGAEGAAIFTWGGSAGEQAAVSGAQPFLQTIPQRLRSLAEEIERVQGVAPPPGRAKPRRRGGYLGRG